MIFGLFFYYLLAVAVAMDGGGGGVYAIYWPTMKHNKTKKKRNAIKRHETKPNRTEQDARANERAALVGDITSSTDRTVRRGMAETVATPLAKLVVNTARQVVVDPLQVCVMSVCVCV